MAVSRGKDFETEFKAALSQVPEISIDRFPDPSAGYAGIHNICDFGVYLHPYEYYFECKAIRKNTLNFNSHITEDQWNGLMEKSQKYGVCAGVCVWFIDHDITVFVPIQQLHEMSLTGQKSLNVKQIISNEVQYVALPGRKKRVKFEYVGQKFMEDLAQLGPHFYKEGDSSGEK
jgi:penicillin-binding protein-related factor A (putative recombinase)